MRILGLVFILIISVTCSAQGILEGYIKESLESNLALQQKVFSYKASINALKEARRMFLPNISIEARYSGSSGGRVDEYDIGEIINPIHKKLNELDANSNFDEDVDPLRIRFLRPTEQETKVRLVQPIYQAEAFIGKRIQSDMVEIKKAEVEAYKRELVAEVKTAYFRYLIATEALKVFDQAEKQLDANLRTAQSLVKNGKATGNVTYRIEAEISTLQAELASAEKDHYLAAAYFNFLLNKPFSEAISIDSGFVKNSASGLKLEDETNKAMQNREELEQLRFSKQISQSNIRLSRASSIPSLAAVGEYGIQGTSYNIGKDDDYIIGSLLFQWNISSFFKKRPKVQQAKFDLKFYDTRLREVQNQIGLEVSRSYFNLVEAEKRIKAAEDKLVSAQKNYDIVFKQFSQSSISHIELIDAQTTLFEARIQAVIANYNYLIRQAEYEKVTAAYTFPDEN